MNNDAIFMCKFEYFSNESIQLMRNRQSLLDVTASPEYLAEMEHEYNIYISYPISGYSRILRPFGCKTTYLPVLLGKMYQNSVENVQST
jgi:hypothetical protein